MTVLEGAIGLEVVKSPIDGSLVSLSPVGSIVLERISKDKAQNG